MIEDQPESLCNLWDFRTVLATSATCRLFFLASLKYMTSRHSLTHPERLEVIRLIRVSDGCALRKLFNGRIFDFRSTFPLPCDSCDPIAVASSIPLGHSMIQGEVELFKAFFEAGALISPRNFMNSLSCLFKMNHHPGHDFSQLTVSLLDYCHEKGVVLGWPGISNILILAVKNKHFKVLSWLNRHVLVMKYLNMPDDQGMVASNYCDCDTIAGWLIGHGADAFKAVRIGRTLIPLSLNDIVLETEGMQLEHLSMLLYAFMLLFVFRLVSLKSYQIQ